jgi:hypothetical protein
MGRKLIHDTPEKKAAAKAAAKAKFTNITVNLDAAEELQKYKEKLAVELGFTPTLGQALKHLIARANT